MEVLFYHLQNTSLDQTLPTLLEKTRAKGWKAVVRATSDERLKALDDHLWTYIDNGFLPHSLDSDAAVFMQPIVLTCTDTRFNDAEVFFAVDGADLPSTVGWTRSVLLFDGNDPDALASARTAWRTVKAQGHDATYWQQDETGRWAKKA